MVWGRSLAVTNTRANGTRRLMGINFLLLMLWVLEVPMAFGLRTAFHPNITHSHRAIPMHPTMHPTSRSPPEAFRRRNCPRPQLRNTTPITTTCTGATLRANLYPFPHPISFIKNCLLHMTDILPSRNVPSSEVGSRTRIYKTVTILSALPTILQPLLLDSRGIASQACLGISAGSRISIQQYRPRLRTPPGSRLPRRGSLPAFLTY